MTLIIGARCSDGVVVAGDRRRMSKHEKGPSTTKLFKLSCGAVLAGAGDTSVLFEARTLIDRRIKELGTERPISALIEVVEITAGVVNELVNCYRDTIEESFGYLLSGLENLGSGTAKLYTVFGGGFSDEPSVCLGSGSSYARSLVELLLAYGKLRTDEAVKTLPTIFTLVSNVQISVGDGLDTLIIKDEVGPGSIKREQEVNLDRMRSAVLNALDVTP
jgi:20S proteasome alpha/beta subunit